MLDRGSRLYKPEGGSGRSHQVTTNLAVLSDTTSYALLGSTPQRNLASKRPLIDASSKVGLAFGVPAQAHRFGGTILPTFSIGARKSIAGILEQSTGPNIALNGHYSGAQIVGKNFVLDPNGNIATASITETRSNAPMSGSSPCKVGQHAWDENFEYRCVVANKWKRIALNSF